MDETYEQKTSSRRRWVAPPDWLLLALLLLLGTVLHVWLVRHTEVPARDSIGYIRYALHLEDRSRSWSTVLEGAEQHPLYPLTILATSLPIRQIRGTTCESLMFSAQVAGALAGALLVVPMFYLGRELFDRRVGFWAAALFQLLPLGAQVTSDGLSDGTFFFLTATALWMAARGMRLRSVWQLALAGLFVGLAYLTRPEGALVGITILVVLLGLQISRSTRWPWRTALAGGYCLLSAYLLVAEPYMAVIGGVTNKPTALKMMHLLDRDDTLPASGAQAPGAPLFAVWFPPEWGDHPDLKWALYALGKEGMRSSQYLLWMPGVLGLLWFRRRLLYVPGLVVILLLWLMYAAVLCHMAMVVGYLSDRHTLFLMMLGTFPAAAMLARIGDWLAALPGLLGRPLLARSRRVVVCTWLAVLFAALLPWTLRPLHANRAGHRAAGLWLRERARATDEIYDPFCWAHYYAGGVLRETEPKPAAATRTRYIILESGDNQHSRLPLVVHARNMVNASHAPEVFRWTPTDRQRHDRAEEVLIFACPLP